MRKDGKSQYQIKKEKLLRIKQICMGQETQKEYLRMLMIPKKSLTALQYQNLKLELIWEIVKDEKDND